MSLSRDSKDDAMRTVLTEGQSHCLHDIAGINKMTVIRAALSSYQANQKNPKPKTEQSSSWKHVAANHEKNNSKAVNFDRKLTTDLTKSSLPTVILTIPTWWVKWYDIPGIDGLPKSLLYLILDYAYYLPEEKVKYKYPDPVNKAPFFTRYISQIQYHLEQAANDLLHDGNIDKGLALIKQNRDVIHIETQGRDRFGRHIQGRTLLQMAAMNGDFNYRDIRAGEKDHGAVELFSKAAGLNQMEVANQLFPVLFSAEAIHENDARINRILNIMVEFFNIMLKRTDLLIFCENLGNDELCIKAKARCIPEFDKLRNDLIRTVSNEVIKSGFIFDYNITFEFISRFTNWYKKNHPGNGGWDWNLICNLIWTGCFGSLQYFSAAPDAHIYRQGFLYVIGNASGKYVVSYGNTLARTLINSDGSSYFSPDSKLGEDYYLAFKGNPVVEGAFTANMWYEDFQKKFMPCKTRSIAKFLPPPKPVSPPPPPKGGCIIL